MAELNLLYLSRADVERVALDLATIISLLSEAFKEKGEGRVEMPPKPGVHTQPDAFIHAMPAFIPSLRYAGIKWVSGYPDNYKRGLPYISGLLVLNDVDSGLPYPVMDSTWISLSNRGCFRTLRTLPGSPGKRDGWYPGLRGAGAHQPGSDGNALPDQAGLRL